MDLGRLNQLKTLAKSATQGDWWVDSHGMTLTAFPDGDVVPLCNFTHHRASVRHASTGNLSSWLNDNDPTYIANLNPETALKLIELAEIGLKSLKELHQ